MRSQLSLDHRRCGVRAVTNTEATKERISLREAFQEFENSTAYWRYPMSVRSRFQQAVSWWPDRDANFLLTQVNATFAKMQRDRAALARGWRAGNFALILLQTLIARAIENGVLTVNRVKQVPRLLPSRQQSNQRRGVKPVRYRISASPESTQCGKSTGEFS